MSMEKRRRLIGVVVSGALTDRLSLHGEHKRIKVTVAGLCVAAPGILPGGLLEHSQCLA